MGLDNKGDLLTSMINMYNLPVCTTELQAWFDQDASSISLHYFPRCPLWVLASYLGLLPSCSQEG